MQHINSYAATASTLTTALDAGDLRPLNAAYAGTPDGAPTTPVPVNRYQDSALSFARSLSLPPLRFDNDLARGRIPRSSYRATPRSVA